MNRLSGDVNIPIGEQHMGAYLAMPARAPEGGVVLIQEIFGVTPAMKAIADDIASAGYAVLVPDIYWRLEPGLDLGNGEDPEQRELAVEYSQRYDERQGTADLVDAVDWLKRQLGMESRPLVMGLCLGGRMAVRVAADAGDRLSGMISMYGVGLDKFTNEIEAIACPVQFHFGDNDNHNPMPVIEAVQTSVTRRKGQGDECFVYPGAQHAFYNRHRQDRFDPEAHGLARTRVLAFAKRCLAAGSPSKEQ